MFQIDPEDIESIDLHTSQLSKAQHRASMDVPNAVASHTSRLACPPLIAAQPSSRLMSASLDSLPDAHSWMIRLQQCEDKATRALEVVKSLNGHLQTLTAATDRVKEQSNRLSSNASSLLAKKSLLEGQCETLTDMLRKFQHIEAVCKEGCHPMLSAASSRFPALMEEIDNAVTFLIANVDMKSSRQFLALVASAQSSTTHALRTALGSCFDTASSTIVSDPQYAACFKDKANLPFKGVHNLMTTSQGDADDDDVPAIFQGHLAALNENYRRHADEHSGVPLRRLLEDRAARCRAKPKEGESTAEEELYWSAQLADHAVVEESMGAFRRSRLLIIEPLVRDHLTSTTRLSLPEAVERLLQVVRDVWEEEQVLFKALWIVGDGPTPLHSHGLQRLEEDIYEYAYQQYRRYLMGTDGLMELGRAHAAIIAACPGGPLPKFVGRMVGDTQERAVNRATTYIRNTLQTSTATKEEMQNLFRTGKDGDEDRLPSVVVCAASFLDVVYRLLDRSVFTIFADECLRVTLAGVLRITKDMGLGALPADVGPGLGPIHALLLRLCCLLRLRENLSAYDASFTVVEQRLDLSHLAQTKLGITQTNREAKKDIETVLKECCDALIDRISTSVCAPSGPEVAEGDVKSLYAEYEVLLGRYVISSATRAVLLRPIRSHIGSNYEARCLKNGVASPIPITWK